MLIHELDNIDKQILNDIQWTFPLVERPFLELANRIPYIQKNKLLKE